MKRSAAALTLTALLALPLLSGCAAGPSEMAPASYDDAGCVVAGSASDGISVSGDFGTNLTLDSGTPVRAASVQRTVLQPGNGPALSDGLTFVGWINIFLGSDGEPYAQEATRHVMDTVGLAPWYYDTVKCGHAGDRIAATVSVAQVLGEGNGDLVGMEDQDTLVVVVDLDAVLSPGERRAVGTPQALPAGFPAVALSEDGRPSVTIPADLLVSSGAQGAATIVGAGPVVEAGSTVLVQSQGVLARTGEVFEQTWDTQPVAFSLDEVIPGLRDGLVGQTVGSQLVIIVPPGSGYTTDELLQGGYEADDVMVWVIDILDVG